MIFQNIEFHNVSYLEKSEQGGYITHRLPANVEEVMAPGGKAASRSITGVELRFKMISDTVKLVFVGNENSTALFNVYRGGVIGSWPEVGVMIAGEGEREIVIKKYADMPSLQKVSEAAGYEFSPEVIRIVPDHDSFRFVRVEGEVAPPEKEDLPSKTYYAYGSSITHGSSSITTPLNFVSLVGEHFRADVRNLGIAGNARLEPEVIREIADAGKRGEWDFASLCMGINILSIDTSEFEERVKYAVYTVAEANPGKHIFCISPFYCNEDMRGSEKPSEFRKVVERVVNDYASPYVHYVCGADILDGPWGLSGDLVHPSPLGVRAIADGLIKEFSKYITR